jgi:formate--tetrahydrofolate ligase
MKGGAAGGGYAQVIPMEDINLHFTGDFSAIERANNLLSALIDNNIQNKENNLGIDPRTVLWKRCMDMNDRSLRNIVSGLGGSANGVPREAGFNITPASEIMAILCLSKDFNDLKTRIGKILVGFTYSGKPVYASELKAQGAMAILLKDAIKPNLVQTLEGNPAILHGGPFANIAQGTNSIIATKTALSLADYVVTESGFASDLGAEKFLDIKCGYGNLKPKTAVIVCTVRALRYHGLCGLENINKPNLDAVKKGIENLEKHIENIQHFGLNPVVAINKFTNDTPEEIDYIKTHCATLGVKAVLADGWANGGNGNIDLANAVVEEIENAKNTFKPIYNWDLSIEEKLTIVAQKMYGADKVELSAKAKTDLNKIKKLGLEKLPICIAKTQKSLSDNEKLIGRPKGFTITIREFEIAAGAGFIIPIAGTILRMPGLPEFPASEGMDIDENGVIYGLS